MFNCHDTKAGKADAIKLVAVSQYKNSAVHTWPRTTKDHTSKYRDHYPSVKKSLYCSIFSAFRYYSKKCHILRN